MTSIAFRRGRGVLDGRDPFAVTLPLGRELWGEADVVLGIGTRLFYGFHQWGTDEKLAIVRVDADRGLLFVSGAVPGAQGSWVVVRDGAKAKLPDNAPKPGAVKGAGEGAGVGTHLALVDDALLRGVEVFDGVLDGDDVVAPLAVEDVDQGGEGRGLAAAGRASDQHHALMEVGEAGERRGQAELLQGGRVRRDGPEHGVDAPLLAVGVATEAADAFQGVGEVHLAAGAQGFGLIGIEDLHHHALGRLGIQEPGIEIGEGAMGAQLESGAAVDVEIARAAFQGVLQQAVESPGNVELEIGVRGRLGSSDWWGSRRRSGCGGLLLGHVVALHGQELLEVLGCQVALFDEDLAEPFRARLAGLPLGRGQELLAGDELVVQGDPPEQEVV